MKLLKLTKESEQMLTSFAHAALTRMGLEALPHVKALENWMATHVQECEDKTTEESPPK